MAKHIVLSDGEWKLMKLLWENHPMTLGDMVEAMQDDTAWSNASPHEYKRSYSYG